MEFETRISALADTRLGIEGHNWVWQLLHNTRDGDAVAMGGLPGTLEADIVREVEFLRRNNITPIVVFNGLAVARKDGRAFSKDDARAANRHRAWELYRQGHTEQAQRGWAAAPALAQGDMVPFVMRVLQRLGVEVMRAPYSSWGQLAYLYHHGQQAVHAVYASLEMLMFDVDRVVTSVSSASATFAWVQREHLVSKCGVGSEQVADMCMLAGFDWCPTLPALVGEGGFSFRFAVDAVRQFRSGFAAIQALGDAGGAGGAGVGAPSYSDSFLRAQCIVRYHIVLRSDGSVGPLNSEHAPNDLHDVIGYRVPLAAYRLLAQGVVQPAAVQMMAGGAWVEPPPPDNGDAHEYRRLVREWQRGVQRSQCARLARSMGPFFAQRRVVQHAWFEPQAEAVLQPATTTTTTTTKPLGSLNLADPASYYRCGEPVSLGGVLERSEELLGNKLGEKLLGNASGEELLGGDHAYAEVLLSVAADLGLLARSGQRTRTGQAALAAIRALRKERAHAAAALEWACVAAAILLDQGALSGARWSVAYEDADSDGLGERERVHVRWLARIAALMGSCGRSACARGPWPLALNRDVLAFSSAARLVAKTAAASADVACVGLARAGAGAWRSSTAARVRALRAEVPLECAFSAASGLVAHAVLAEHARGGEADVAAGVDGAQQALRDAWALSAAVLAAAEALGAATAAAELRSARAWAEPVLGRDV
ncbi:hypothetical protein GGF38_001789 [Coemansia sp. RSA 25]|nr:hypothetical protein GGF38_001789 [Coemansia sp. RSA 25]